LKICSFQSLEPKVTPTTLKTNFTYVIRRRILLYFMIPRTLFLEILFLNNFNDCIYVSEHISRKE